MPETGRRNFALSLIGTLGTIIGLGYLFVAERFMLPRQSGVAQLQNVGASTDFVANEAKLVVYTGQASFPTGVYILRLSGQLVAYDEHCAHLQCPVQWTAATKTFDCPCHGSVYNIDGQRIAGPAPHPLNYHQVLERSGSVYVGGIIPWGTPAWNAEARKLGLPGK